MSLDIWLRCDCCGMERDSLNVTHNMTPMWHKAGVYADLYESDGDKALEHIDSLARRLNHMLTNRDEYLPLEPANGWGSYQSAVAFLANWVNECANYPSMTIRVWK